MKYGLYAIKDVKIGFLNPFLSQNDASAVRGFAEAANEKNGKNPVNEFIEDKELWKIGEYDDQTAEIASEIRFLTKAVDCLKGE